jgi:hypothetical protein
LLDIQLPFLGRDADIVLDGRRVGAVRRPSIDQPWSEATIDIEGSPVTVSLAWNRMTVLTDVFVGRISLRDGRLIEEARRAAPKPVRGFDRWFQTNLTGFADLHLFPRWLMVVVGLWLIGTIVVFAWSLRGLAAGLLVGGGLQFVAICLIEQWLILTAKTHRYLSAQPELGDLRRAAILVGVFAAFPLLFGSLFLTGGFILRAIEGSMAPASF